MKLSAPKKVTWIVAVVVGVIGILGMFTKLPVVGDFSDWFVVAAFVLLALATYLKGL